ncbi:MAG: alpha/beta hydrolase [Bacteroidales bacterium]|nr:alpha/beta hydrolase [Bacteroidales bacterium]
MKKITLTLVSLLSFFLVSVGQTPQDQQPRSWNMSLNLDYSERWTDVNYVGDGKEYHNLDIYLPKEIRSTYKPIIIIYGSAWLSNNSKGAALMSLAQPLLDAGYAVISINHRSSSDALWPAQINDVKAAIRFVRAKAKSYKIDSSWIGITGFSSGGHLSAYAGVSNGDKTLTVGNTTIDVEGSLGDFPSISSNVDAVVDWFGPVDMARMNPTCDSTNGPESPEAALIGGDPRTNPDKIALISPINFIDKKDVPFFLIHGDKDETVPQCQSIYLNEALQKGKVKSTFVSVPGGGHGPGCLVKEYYDMMVDFFNKEGGR